MGRPRNCETTEDREEIIYALEEMVQDVEENSNLVELLATERGLPSGVREQLH
ncbi:MAG: hypothetical protein PHC51_06695 [bacterium]|nr:hypothetical protein [bacterium]